MKKITHQKNRSHDNSSPNPAPVAVRLALIIKNDGQGGVKVEAARNFKLAQQVADSVCEDYRFEGDIVGLRLLVDPRTGRILEGLDYVHDDDVPQNQSFPYGYLLK